MRIGFDMDGVLADFIYGITQVAKDLNFPIDTKHWGLGLTEEQQDKCWERIRATEYFWEDLPTLEPIILNKLSKEHTLYFVTSRVPTAGPTIEKQTAEWLQWELEVDHPQVVVAEPASQKVPIYNALRLDAFIDDKPSTVKLMLQAGQNAYIYDQPWNQEAEAPRVKTIKEYLERIGVRGERANGSF